MQAAVFQPQASRTANSYTGAAGNASFADPFDLRFAPPRFGIMTPPAPENTPFQAHRRADDRPGVGARPRLFAVNNYIYSSVPIFLALSQIIRNIVKTYNPMDIPVFELSGFLHPGETFHMARVNIVSRQDLSFHTHDYAELLWIEKGAG